MCPGVIRLVPALMNTTLVPSALIPPPNESPLAAAPAAPVARLTRVVVSATVSRTNTFEYVLSSSVEIQFAREVKRT